MIPLNRPLYFLLFFVCHELIIAAYYFEYFMGLMPCPLCMVSRLWVVALGVVFLIAALHKPSGAIQKAYHVVIGLIALLGVATSAHHVYLQSLPASEVPNCGPGLEHMLNTLPFTEVLNQLIQGSGECAEVSWSFIGLSMPAWMLVFYCVMVVVAILPFLQKDRQYRFRSNGE